MAIRMTREEYENQYGVKPVVNTDTFDTTPAPVRMTRAEYEAKYRPQQETQRNALTRTLTDIPSDIADTGRGIARAVTDAGKAVNQAFTQPGLSVAQRGVGALASAVSAIPNVAGEAILGVGKLLTTDEFEKAVANKIGETGQAVVESDFGQKVASFYDSLPEDQKFTLTNIIAPTANVLTSGPALGAGAKVVEKTGDALTAAREVSTTIRQTLDDRAVERVAAEIAKVEDKYAPLRRANNYGRDVEGSRTRIAQSNVLVNAVDENGILKTTDAAKEYKRLTVDGVEDVVRRNLVNEGKTVNLAEIEGKLKRAIYDSGLEGSDLVTAIRGVQKEIQGLKLRADELGNVGLDKLQDAKISTTGNINFNTPPEVATYRKSVARAYKEFIEAKSDTNVKEINDELAKYYGDIERIKALDGRRVEGGRLGKYTAALTGSAIGMAAGSAGGGFGAAVGGIVGGEAASALKGRAMSKTFSRGIKGNVPENTILKNAKTAANTGKKVDLRKPSPKVGAPANVPKTAEIKKLEAQIARNVSEQKKAIKAGDFTLVATLKDIYDSLVEALREAVRFVRENYRDQGGYIKNPLAQSNPRKRIQMNTTNPATTNSMSSKVQSVTKTVKLSEVEKRQVADALESYDSDPSTVKVMGRDTIAFGDNLDEQIGVLKEKMLSGKFSNADAVEAARLLDAKKIPWRGTERVAGNLLEEAKGKTLEEFVESVFNKEPEYGMSHRPSWEGSPSAANLLEGDMLPRDVYQKPEWSIASGRTMSDPAVKESWDALMKIRNKPEAEITVWRATPKNELNIGDWVSFSKKYAEGEGAAEGTKAYPFKVRAKDVLFAGDDINEFGYFPRTQLEDIWKQANGKTGSTALLEEAKKYKSVDEFVKAQGTPVYHGGNKVTDIKVGKDSFTGKPVGFSTTPDKAFAERYSQQISRDGEVTELYLKPNAKILDKTEAGIDPHIDPTYSADANLIKDAIAQGYDAVRMRVTAPGGLNEGTSIELQILNPDAVKTKAQLEELWKQVNKR